MMLRHLRHKYDFVPMSMSEASHADLFYLDAIILFHPYSPSQSQFIHRAKTHYHIPVIVDIDDLVTDMPTDHPYYREFKGHAIPDIIMLADHLTTSTEYLKRAWGHLNKNTHVIENCIDEDRYKGLLNQPKNYKSGFVVGYTGGHTHAPDLLYNMTTGCLEGLVKFMEKYSDVRAHFHNLCPQPMIDKFGSRVSFNEKVVDYLDYPSLCYTFPWDVCIVPLQDHPFNHAKSDLRLLDMAPFSIPVVASDVEPFRPHGLSQRAFVVKDQSWFDSLEYCYLNSEEVRQVADRAREYVLHSRSSRKSVEAWDALLQSLFHSP